MRETRLRRVIMAGCQIRDCSDNIRALALSGEDTSGEGVVMLGVPQATAPQAFCLEG
jgi:hypothetical protein